jgi:hypothetical protein
LTFAGITPCLDEYPVSGKPSFGIDEATVNMRGLFPSLGAGGSLIAAALCALAVFGGVLAFRGDTAPTAEADTGDLSLPVGEVRARTVAQTSPTPRTPTAATRAQPRRLVTSRRRNIAAPPPPPVAAPRAETAPKQRPTTPPDDIRTSAPPSGVATHPPPRVERTLAQIRAAARPVIERAPQPVEMPVNAIGDAAQQDAGTLDQTVGNGDDTVGGLLR